MLRKVRKNYRRFVSFLLAFVMTFTNVGSNLGIAFAGGEDQEVLYQLSGEDLQAAIQDAVAGGEVCDPEEFAFGGTLKEDYEELFDGNVYQLDVDAECEMEVDGASMEVYYDADKEQVVFLFVNESDMIVDFSVDVDGYMVENVVVKPNASQLDPEDEKEEKAIGDANAQAPENHTSSDPNAAQGPSVEAGPGVEAPDDGEDADIVIENPEPEENGADTETNVEVTPDADGSEIVDGAEDPSANDGAADAGDTAVEDVADANDTEADNAAGAENEAADTNDTAADDVADVEDAAADDVADVEDAADEVADSVDTADDAGSSDEAESADEGQAVAVISLHEVAKVAVGGFNIPVPDGEDAVETKIIRGEETAPETEEDDVVVEPTEQETEDPAHEEQAPEAQAPEEQAPENPTPEEQKPEEPEAAPVDPSVVPDIVIDPGMMVDPAVDAPSDNENPAAPEAPAEGTQPAEPEVEIQPEETPAPEENTAPAPEESAEPETSGTVTVPVETEETEETKGADVYGLVSVWNDTANARAAVVKVAELNLDLVIEEVSVELAQTVDGVTVKVNAEEGVLPENTEMTVEAVELSSDKGGEQWENLVAATEEDEVAAYAGVLAYDITLHTEEEENVQPDGPVTVTFDGTGWGGALKGARVIIYHIAEDNTVEKIAETEASDAISFEAEHFSTYAMVAEEPGVMPMKISGSTEVEVGGTITLTSDVHNGSNHKWSSSDDETATVTGKPETNWGWNGKTTTYTGVVTGVNPGKVTITHTYTTENGNNEKTYTETYVVNVIAHGQRTVTFDKNGGGGNAPQSQRVEEGGTITLPGQGNMTARNGYVFVGWSTNSGAATASGNVNNPENTAVYPAGSRYTVEKNVTLYAIWAQQNVTATFYIRLDGKMPKEPGSYLTSQYTTGITINGVLKEAYFYYNPQGVNSKLNATPSETQIKEKVDGQIAGKTYTIGTDYIVWYVIKHEWGGWHVDGVLYTSDKVTLTYDENVDAGYSSFVQGIPLSQQYDKDTMVTVEGTPTWPGHTFQGWALSKDGPVVYHAGGQFTITEDTVLYAIWDEVKIDITGTKTWVDGGKSHNNADEVTLTLSRTSAKAGSATETVEGVTATWVGDTYTFKNVPECDAEGNKYTYSVTEAAVDGYTTEQTGNNFTNTVNTINDKIDVTGTKTWVDGGKGHNNAEEVKLTLSRTSAKAGSKKETVEATATWDGNKYTFKDVAKYDAEGYAYTYSVAEAKVDGYMTTQSGNNFTNTIEQDSSVSVSGTKTWIDPEGSEHPEVTIQLLRDGKEYKTTALVDNAYSFTGLDKYDLKDGHVYEYTVEELEVEGYTSEKVGDYDFKNTIEQDSTVEVSGTKTWIDPKGSKHPEVTIQLLRDGEAYKTTTLVDDAYSFTGLDKYDLTDGHVYEYTVEELEVEGYTSVKNGTNFTNTIKQDSTVSVSGTKTWIDPKGSEHPEVTIQLLRDGDAYKTTKLENDAYSFENLDKYDLSNGHVYEYTVEELEVEGYTSVKDGTNFTNTIKQDSTVSVSGTKTWIDPKGSKHPEVTIQLLRDGEKYKTTTLVNDAYSFTGLDKYDLSDGHVYEYTVEEFEVKGYTSVKNGTNFTNTIAQDSTVSVSGTKTWIDPEGSKHPEVTIQLLRDGKAYKTTTLENDAYSFTGLDKYDLTDGHVYVYTVKELSVPGYTSVKNGTNFTNTIEQDSTVSVSGTKTWIDPEGSEHPEVTIQLLKDGKPAGTTVLVDDAYSFTGLDRYDLTDGHVYEYTVEELSVPGYTSVKNGTNFTNTIKQDSTVSVSGTKTWIDPKGSEHPEVTIQLLRDGNEYKTTKLVNDAYSFTDLDKYDLEDGHVYEYTVKELAVDGYTSAQDGTNFTNTIAQDSTVSVSGTKKWIDPEGSKHPEVTIQLLRDGEPADVTTLVNDAYSFTGLDKYDLSDGHVYKYTVKELEVPGYTSVQNGTNFTNTIAQDDTVSVSGTKIWIDPEGSEHPEVTIQLLRDGEAYKTTKLENDEYKFENLDRYDLADGHVYKYTVEELSVPGYTSEKVGDYGFKNTIEQDSTVSVSGTKTWIDPEGSEHPEVTIQLLRDGNEYKTTTLVNDAYSFTGLDKYDLEDGHVYEYTVKELAVDGYTSAQDGTNFTNTIEQDSTVEVSGTKTWIAPEGIDHPEVTIQLLRDGKPAGTTTLVDDAYSFTGLDKYDLEDGHVYEYTVKELAVDGYTSVKNGTNFTNTIVQDSTVSVSGTKTWIDPEGSEHPEVTIQLLRDGKPAGTTTLVDDAYSFTGLDKYDLSDGHVYEYTVEELEVEGYTSAQDGTNFTNTIAQDSTVSVSGTKTWIDPEGSEHPEVTIQLLRDGKPAGTTTLVDDAYSFTGLDKYDLKDGHVYEYTVEELAVPDYTSVKDGTNFTNTIVQDSTVEVSGTKKWIDPEGSEHPEVTIQLLRDGEAYRTTKLENDAYSFTGLDKYDLSDGHVYKYTVEELPVSGYTSEKVGDYDFTNTIAQDSAVSVSGTKKWVDPEGSEHPEITIQLLRDGEAYKTTTLENDAYSFTGLDKYDLSDGHVYEYTVEELEVEGYTSVQDGTNFTNTIAQDSTVSVSGTKTWIDPEGSEHPEVTIQLLRDGEAAGTTTLVDDKYSFTGLDKYDLSDGHVYEYTVEELAVPGYTSVKNGTNFTNTIVQDNTVSVSGTKTWVDGNNMDNMRPGSITINLLRDKTKIDSKLVTADEDGNWNWSWTGLDKYDLTDGHVYEYTIKEDEVAGYTSEVSGYNVTNTHEIEKIAGGVKVSKIWNDVENRDRIRPTSVTIQLQQNGEDYGNAVVLDQSNNWSYTWEDVPVHVENKVGILAEYSVVESNVPEGYEASYSKDTENSFIVTNTHEVAARVAAIDIAKSLTNPPARGSFRANEVAEFDITVTNTGNVALRNVVVTDTLEGAAIEAGEGYTLNESGNAVIAEMAPAQRVVIHATYRVTNADVNAGSFTNGATATGESTDTVDPDTDPTPEDTVTTDPIPTSSYTGGGSDGGSGGGGGGSTGGTSSGTTTITDAAVPLATIDPGEVPLAALPQDLGPMTAIDDEGVPLAAILPKTGDTSRTRWFLIMAILSLFGLGALETGVRKEKRKEEE